ncbi:MAG: hypothetical protein ACRD0V_00815, partial [Acidimicrobiales bacterium]
ASGICPAAGSTGMVIERDRGYRPLLLLEFEGRPRPRTHRTGGQGTSRRVLRRLVRPLPPVRNLWEGAWAEFVPFEGRLFPTDQ